MSGCRQRLRLAGIDRLQLSHCCGSGLVASRRNGWRCSRGPWRCCLCRVGILRRHGRSAWSGLHHLILRRLPRLVRYSGLLLGCCLCRIGILGGHGHSVWSGLRHLALRRLPRLIRYRRPLLGCCLCCVGILRGHGHAAWGGLHHLILWRLPRLAGCRVLPRLFPGRRRTSSQQACPIETRL